jgi:vancomycin resistance protein YoaR
MAVDREAALAALDAAILRLESDAFIELAVSEIQPAVTSVEAAAEKLRAAVSGDLHLVAVGENGEQLGPWTATAAQISEVLSLQLTHQADGTAAYTVDFDAEAFRAHLETLAPGLVIPPRDARFRFNPAIGALELHRPAVSGRQLDIDETLNRLADGVFQRDNRTVPMAFVYTLPRYHNQITAQELGIRELVGQSTTTFQGSGSNRRTNIAVSASRIDGVIIAPGEEFSFNNVIGDISPEAGYLEDKLIFGGRTVDGVGGGVCQLSTTVFRGALVSGFPIIERNSHGYRVGYYEQGGQPPGLDAAIWQPERDLRFLNDTPYHLLIEIDVFPADDALQIRLYSTNPGRVVEIEAPIIRHVVPAPAPRFEANGDLRPGETLQVDYAAEGADVTVYRNIYGLDGELITRDHIYTHYLPWGAIYQVAPTDSRLANTG